MSGSSVMPRPLGDVVVLGASVAGLLTAAALSELADSVRVIDRDDLGGDLEAPRDGTPQAGHTHAVLMGGLAAMDDLLPGLSASLVDDGALLADVLGRTRWIVDDLQQAHQASGDAWMLVSRTLLESRLRRRVRALPGVSLTGGLDIGSPVVEPGSRRISGVVVTPRSGPSAASETLTADLVVDATGRAPRSVAWLRGLGLDEPPETVVEAGVRYVTRRFRHEPGVLEGYDAELVGPHLGSQRCGVALRQEHDTWTVTLIGRFGEDPPLDLDGFREFARSLPSTGIAEVTQRCTPTTEPLRATFPVSRWRHWEKLETRLAGLVVVGDAVASVNPSAGQGMTMSALQVRALRDVVREHGADRLEARAAAALANAVADPWVMGTSYDTAYLKAGGSSVADRVLDAYLDRVIAVGTQRPEVAHALTRVLHLVDSTSALLRPSIAWAVLGPGSRRAVARAKAERTTRHAAAAARV